MRLRAPPGMCQSLATHGTEQKPTAERLSRSCPHLGAPHSVDDAQRRAAEHADKTRRHRRTEDTEVSVDAAGLRSGFLERVRPQADRTAWTTYNAEPLSTQIKHATEGRRTRRYRLTRPSLRSGFLERVRPQADRTAWTTYNAEPLSTLIKHAAREERRTRRCYRSTRPACGAGPDVRSRDRIVSQERLLIGSQSRSLGLTSPLRGAASTRSFSACSAAPR
jgi:hypothetical protein